MNSPDLQLGLRENWSQFALLVIVNAFVGAMVGLERAVLPLVAETEFGLASRVAVPSSHMLVKKRPPSIEGPHTEKYAVPPAAVRA